MSTIARDSMINEISPTESDLGESFYSVLTKHELRLDPLSIHTLQVNISRLCNQTCSHCHVDASPERNEQMDRQTVDQCLEILARHNSIRNLDITGGAPELNPHFCHFVTEARKLGKNVMVRHNLTVTLDGDPQNGETKTHVPRFFAGHQVEVIASLPCYGEENTDKQRGNGVFKKSLEGIRLLNAQGYGRDGSGLVLNLVYNPGDASLPPGQGELEAAYKDELSEYDLTFNNLYTMTNIPINRFKATLQQSGLYDQYMAMLVGAFNPEAAKGAMCRSQISVGYDGRIYDCDFNQMLEMEIRGVEPMTIFNFQPDVLINRNIRFSSHCFGCTAGGGSSCGGALT